jgi:uncharacterized protein YeaO (DUF488 family)
MLYRASVRDVKSGSFSRKYAHLAIVMQFYPRGLSKEVVDENLHCLAPDRELFAEFKAKEKSEGDHNRAFELVAYEARFTWSETGLENLERLTEISKERDVFLICQCFNSDRCHADLLLLLARARFSAKIPFLRQRYPVFEARLKTTE